MENEGPDVNAPKWLICLFVLFLVIFIIPSLALGTVFGIIFWPIALICGCTFCVAQSRIDLNPNATPRVTEVMVRCGLIWLLFFFAIAFLLPGVIIVFIYNAIRVIPPFSLCLPECTECCVVEPNQANGYAPEVAEPDDQDDDQDNDDDVIDIDDPTG